MSLPRTAADYRYRHVTPERLKENLAFPEDTPGPGGRVPDLDLPTADGGRFRSRDLRASGRPMLLILGSLTCPMTAGSNPMLKELHARFGNRIQFVTLHVREAHPGERIDQADEEDAKTSNARALMERDRLPWPVAVDDAEGTIHRALGSKPNAAWLTDGRGEIVFRSLWAGDRRGVTQALASVAEGRRPVEQSSTRRMSAMARGIGVMRQVLRRAGPRAEADLWRTAAPIAFLARLADVFRPLPPPWRTVAAATTVAVTAATLAVALERILSSGRHRR